MLAKFIDTGNVVSMLNLLVKSHVKLSIILLWEKCIATAIFRNFHSWSRPQNYFNSEILQFVMCIIYLMQDELLLEQLLDVSVCSDE